MKKAMNYLFSHRARACMVAAAMFIFGGTLVAQTVSNADLIKRVFAVSKEATLEVENKYGTILVVPWQKDSVQISADIFLEAKNRSKLRKLKNDVDVSVSGTKNYVVARTRIGEGSSRISAELRALSNTLSGKSAVEINYTLYVPQDINLFLTNKFGDIYIDDISGKTDISLSNGVLKANSFTGNTTLELTFAEARINEITTATANLSFAEITVGSAGQFDVTSKSSEIDVEQVDVFKFNSRRDEISLGYAEYLYGFSDFTDIEVINFIREADCDMKYGKIYLDHVDPGFSMINLKSEYTGVSLFIERESSFDLDIEHYKQVRLNLPQPGGRFDTRNTGGDYRRTTGTYGNNDGDRRINIRADQKTYINISIRK